MLALLLAGRVTLANDVTSVNFGNVPSALEGRRARSPGGSLLPLSCPSSRCSCSVPGQERRVGDEHVGNAQSQGGRGSLLDRAARDGLLEEGLFQPRN